MSSIATAATSSAHSPHSPRVLAVCSRQLSAPPAAEPMVLERWGSRRASRKAAQRVQQQSLPVFQITSPAESREPSPSLGSATEGGGQQQSPATMAILPDGSSSGSGSRPDRPHLRQHSDYCLRPSVSFGTSTTAATTNHSMDESARRRSSGGMALASAAHHHRLPFFVDKRSAASGVERLPLRAFKKIGRVGTLPAMAHTSAPVAGIQSAMDEPSASTPLGGTGPGSGGGTSTTRTGGGAGAFQRWTSNNRRGSHLIGWDSARPQSTARHQQQMLERMYSKSELREYQQLFKMFDTDGSGAIGCEELKGAMLSIGMQADDAEIEQLIKEVDEDGNGEIDFPEFCQCMKRSQQSGLRAGRPSNEEVARQCFEVFDQDGNGLITENEFIYVAKEVGGFSQELAEFVFRELLGDSASGQLDPGRFSAIVDDYMFANGGEGGGSGNGGGTANDAEGDAESPQQRGAQRR